MKLFFYEKGVYNFLKLTSIIFFVFCLSWSNAVAVVVGPPYQQYLTASCNASPISATNGQSVTWTATPSGGSGTGYTYIWSGDVSGTASTESTSYTDPGTKTATVKVTDSNGISIISPSCSTTVTSPSVNQPPVISLIGANPFNFTVGAVFIDPGATAIDAEDGNLTSQIIATSTVNTGVLGAYIITYSVTDSGGLSASATRVVNIVPLGPVTLNVINLVVNGTGGTAVPSGFNVHVKNNRVDVSGSPAAGAVTPGTSYSLSAGTYVVSEDANTSYTQSFAGDCDSSGNITLSAGDDKTCTIVNTDIPLPVVVAPISSSGGGGSISTPVAIVPVIAMTDIPSPLNLPAGPGSVTYNYTVRNVGTQQSLANISVKDDKCSPITFVSGDLNNNSLLDPGESWEYSCTTTVSKTTINTVVAMGYSNDIYHTATTDINTAIVAVGTSVVPPLIDITKIPSQLTPLPYGGGIVTYTYTVTNPGTVPMNNITVTDNKCSPVTFVSSSAGTNSSSLLQPGETLTYTCQTNVPVSTINTAVAAGRANGFTSLAYAFSTVLVSSQNLVSTNQANATETINLVKQQLISLITQLIQQLQVQLSAMIASGQ